MIGNNQSMRTVLGWWRPWRHKYTDVSSLLVINQNRKRGHVCSSMTSRMSPTHSESIQYCPHRLIIANHEKRLYKVMLEVEPPIMVLLIRISFLFQRQSTLLNVRSQSYRLKLKKTTKQTDGLEYSQPRKCTSGRMTMTSWVKTCNNCFENWVIKGRFNT